MPPGRTELAHRLMELADHLYMQMRPHAPEEWPHLELTMPQVRVLMLLSQGPRRMSELATFLGSGLPAATSMVDRLVGKGLVERASDPQDRRVVTCCLTGDGGEVVEQIWRISRSRMRRLVDLLSLEELRTVVQAMEVLAGAMERQGGPPVPSGEDIKG